MREHEINSLNNFIGGWYLSDTTICDKLIEYHNTSHKKYYGVTASLVGDAGIVDKEQKDSTDVLLEDSKLFNDYFSNSLLPVTELYKKRYSYSAVSSWGVTEYINIQHYNPHGGFKAWHTERSVGIPPYSNRHLVFMTYLNDVTDSGETEFYYQNIKVKPEKGLTLIWGADWTFTHRGIPSPTQEKYIATGWYSFT